MTDRLQIDGGAGAQETTARPKLITLFGRPVWILAGQIGIGLCIVLGFKAYQPVKPNLFIALLLCCLVAALVFGPTGRVQRIVLTAPTAAILTWWIMSGLWTFNTAGWRRDSELLVPLILGLVAIVGLLPIPAIFRGLVGGCQAAMAWTILFTLTNPGVATSHSDGTPGWTGGFIHKNGLAPFMLFAILVAWSFEDNTARRRAMFVIAGFFIVMSQSTTVLALAVIIIPLGVLIRRIADATVASRTAMIVTSIAAGTALALALISTAESLLATRGKDLTLTSRTEIWAGVWSAIEQRPLLGYGAGGVWINPARDPARSIMRPLGFTVFHSHNGYLELMLQLGLVGLVLVLILMSLVLAFGAMELRRDVNVGAFMMMYVVLVAITSLSEVTTLGVWLALLCAFQAITVRLGRDRRSSRPGNDRRHAVRRLQTSARVPGWAPE